ncbi:MAG TPA: hypothetical protein PKA53_08360 [Sphingobacterium sp.]|nr:hypothetical protein [Sphingobacterium sp.]
MDTKNTKEQSYLPVAWEYLEVIAEQIDEKTDGKIFFFNADGQVDEAKGRVIEIVDEKQNGVYLLLDKGVKIRIDRIITLFGKIGAAYEEYDAYGNACMDCLGGYEKEDL